MAVLPVFLAVAALAAAPVGGVHRDDGILRVRATPAVAPCVEAAARAYEKKTGQVIVATGSLTDAATADVLVGAAAEVTRALEGGAAAADSDAHVARVKWVLVVPAGNPNQIQGLADAERAAVEVWVAGGPAAYEARRAVEKAAPARVREASDGAVPRGAAAALAPTCLAGPGERVAVDVPDLVVEAAVSATASRPEAARGFVAFLASPAGRRAFAPGP
jgi:ABC-type molybdate transport system substrate-binding protein